MNTFKKLTRFFGLEILKIQKHQATIESHLTTLFRHLDIDLVLDVGANNGGYGKMLRQMGYKGLIVSFEPVADCFKALEQASAGDDRWVCHNFALGSRQEELTIHVPSSSDFSSFLEVSDKAREIWSEDFSRVTSQKVQVKTLDQVFPDILSHADSRQNIFLKMDTQGFDLEVFKGSAQSLNRISALQSEVSVFPIYDHMPDYMEALKIYREKGFEITGLYPVSRNQETLMVVEFDCVMIKQR